MAQPVFIKYQGPGGSLISREKYIDGVLSTSRTYHFDGLGSTIALTDENGNTTDTYSYDAWGNVTHTSGTTDDNPYQYVGEYGYYTHYQEGYAEDGSLNFKLLQLGVRYYDPSTGRFTQQDPIKDGLNWFGYAGGNPIGSVDPSGLMSTCRFWDMWDAYISGDQDEPYHISVTELDLSAIPLNKFDTLYGLIKKNKPGEYKIDEYRIVDFDLKKAPLDAFAIGNINLHLIGTLIIDKDGTWTFTGKAVGNKDNFDFNKSTHRSAFAEFLTSCGRSLEIVGAKPYEVRIDGVQPVMWSNKSREPIIGPIYYPTGEVYEGNSISRFINWLRYELTGDYWL